MGKNPKRHAGPRSGAGTRGCEAQAPGVDRGWRIGGPRHPGRRGSGTRSGPRTGWREAGHPGVDGPGTRGGEQRLERGARAPGVRWLAAGRRPGHPGWARVTPRWRWPGTRGCNDRAPGVSRRTWPLPWLRVRNSVFPHVSMLSSFSFLDVCTSLPPSFFVVKSLVPKKAQRNNLR